MAIFKRLQEFPFVSPLYLLTLILYPIVIISSYLHPDILSFPVSVGPDNQHASAAYLIISQKVRLMVSPFKRKLDRSETFGHLLQSN